MKKPDPRLAKIERLLGKALQLLSDIKTGVAAPRRRRRRRWVARPRYSHAGILAALQEGAAFNAEPRDPRLPSPYVLRKLRQRDAAFDLDVRGLMRARVLASVRRPWPLEKRRAKQRITFNHADVLARIREGARISASPPEPGMPPQWAIQRDRRTDPAFDVGLRQAVRFAQRKRPPPRVQVRSEYPQYSREAAAAAIEAGASTGPKSKNRGALPPHHVIERWIAIDPAFAARVCPLLAARHAGLGPEDFDPEAVLEKVRSGVAIDERPPAAGMPSYKVFGRMRRRSLAFDKAAAAALAEGKRRRLNQHHLAKLGRDAIWRLAQAAVPRSMDADVRNDIVSELAVKLLSGEVGADDDLAAAWKRCRTKITGHRWKETSLDAPLNGLEGATRLDMLPADHPRF
jgi:hypothetical protein